MMRKVGGLGSEQLCRSLEKGLTAFLLVLNSPHLATSESAPFCEKI